MTATITKLMRTAGEPPLKRLTFDFPGVERCIIQEFQTHTLLRKLEVMPLFRGQGIGSRVLRELKRRGRPIRLTAYPDDPNRYDELMRFYQCNGFVEDEGTGEMVWSP